MNPKGFLKSLQPTLRARDPKAFPVLAMQTSFSWEEEAFAEVTKAGWTPLIQVSLDNGKFLVLLFRGKPTIDVFDKLLEEGTNLPRELIQACRDNIANQMWPIQAGEA